MPIEVVPAQLYALAGVLEAAAVHAGQAGAATAVDPVGGPLGPVVAGFAETVGTAGRCLAGELSWLGAAVEGAADSWLGLDRSLLAAPGRAVAE